MKIWVYTGCDLIQSKEIKGWNLEYLLTGYCFLLLCAHYCAVLHLGTTGTNLYIFDCTSYCLVISGVAVIIYLLIKQQFDSSTFSSTGSKTNYMQRFTSDGCSYFLEEKLKSPCIYIKTGHAHKESSQQIVSLHSFKFHLGFQSGFNTGSFSNK